jgi:hypothetical protein
LRGGDCGGGASGRSAAPCHDAARAGALMASDDLGCL